MPKGDTTLLTGNQMKRAIKWIKTTDLSPSKYTTHSVYIMDLVILDRYKSDMLYL